MSELQKIRDPESRQTIEHLMNALSRIDWQQVFVWASRLLAGAAVMFLTYRYSVYFLAFGVGALAMIGQFIVGLFFMFSMLNATSGLQVMTAAAGLYLLVNSF